MLKVNDRDTRTRCEVFSTLTIKTPEDVVVNIQYISHVAPVFLYLTLN